MGDILKKNWFVYFIEIIIAVVIININFTAFWVYFFFVVLFKADMSVDYLRKLIRVFQVGNECKLIAIIRKLKITDSEISEVGKDVESELTQPQLDSLKSDIRSLYGR